MKKTVMMVAVSVMVVSGLGMVGAVSAQPVRLQGLMSSGVVDGFVSHVVMASYPGLQPLGVYDGAFLYGMKSNEFPNVMMLVSARSLQPGEWKWCRSAFPDGVVVNSVHSTGEQVIVSFKNAPGRVVRPDAVAPAVSAMATPACALGADLPDVALK